MRHEEQLLNTIQALKAAQPITWRITVASALSLSNDSEIATFGRSLQNTAATQSEARHERTEDEVNQFVDEFLSQRKSYI